MTDITMPQLGETVTEWTITKWHKAVGEEVKEDEILYEVEVEGDAPEERLRALVDHVDEIAEIPNSLRQGTKVRLAGSSLTGN